MIIKPYIVNPRGEIEALSNRELRVNSENLAISRYKRKLYYLSDDYQLLLHRELPVQDDYLFPDDLTNVKFLEESGKDPALYIDLPSANILFAFAEMGLDTAVTGLRILSGVREEDAEKYNRALNFRKRYERIPEMTYRECKLAITKSTKICPTIAQLRGRFLAYPLNNSYVLGHIKKNTSFKVKNYLKDDFSTLGFNAKLNESSVRKYFDANLFFLQSIFNENPSDLIERDHLTYASMDQNQLLDAAQAFLQRSNEFYRYTKNWKNSSNKKLVRLAKDVIRRSVSESLDVQFSQLEKENNLKRLSIFTLAAIDFDPRTVNKLNQLHKMGLRQIGSLANILE